MQAAVSYLSRRRLALAALVAGCALLSACTTVVREPAQQHHVVVREVPAPLVEVIPGPPGPGLHWVPGHWAWREGDWRWTTRFAYQIIERRGTGGGGFRKMYAEFLNEAASADPRISDLQLPQLMTDCAACWTSLALALKAGSESECFPTKLLADALQAVRAAERRYIDAALIY